MANLSFFNFTIRQISLLLLFIVVNNLVSAAFIPRKFTRPQLDQTHTHPIFKRNPLPLPVPQDFLEAVVVPTPPPGGVEVVPTPPPGAVDVIPTPPPEAVPTPPPGAGGEVLVPAPPPEAITPLPEPVTPLPPAVTPIGPAVTPIPGSGAWAGSGGIGEAPVVVTPAAAKRTGAPRVVRRKLKLL
ncbi:hypothetical protein B0H65DRAFT_545285 [Neurospora tetraspora]|uniref:Uncharacterized protein n=1 Tax=Neurospora tetraspora TaxID=94610 RepID=A0AAE0MXL7_9PEZI|nr:hypothetical protein B0H65DRAFT_545285 [Neurospora tetraspora]